MGLGADFIRAPRRGRLLIVYPHYWSRADERRRDTHRGCGAPRARRRGDGVEAGGCRTTARLAAAVPLLDRVWITGIGGRLLLRFSRRLSTVTTPAARLLRFEGDEQNCSRRNLRCAYIANCSKSVAAGPPSRCANSSCKKNCASPLTGSANTAFVCSSYSQAAAFLGSGHEFRSAAASLQITRRS